MNLFDNCLILSSCSIDDSCVVLEYPAFNKCDELLDAMNRLQQLLKERRSSAAGGLMGELLCFMSGLEGRLEDAATEVILVKDFWPSPRGGCSGVGRRAHRAADRDGQCGPPRATGSTI